MELSLKDFQGHVETSLTVEGLTVVLGPSDRGKSSVGRALKAALRNGITEGNVRLGSKEARVALSLKDHEIETSRSAKGSSTYVVDGAEFAKLGGAIPPVMADWGYQPVEVNGVTIDPIFAGQFDAQFLLSSSPAETSAVLNAFASTERLDKGRKALKSEISDVDAKAKALGSQISSQEVLVADLTEKATTAEDLRITLSQQMAVARTLNQKLKALRTLYDTSVGIQQVQGRLKSLVTVDAALVPVFQRYSAAWALHTLQVAGATRTHISRSLTAIVQVDPAVDLALSRYLRLERLERIRRAQIQRASVEAQVQSLLRITVPMDTVARSYKALVRVRALLINDPKPVRKRADAIADLSAQITPTEVLAAKSAALLRAMVAVASNTRAAAELSSTQDELQRALQERAQAETELDTWRTSNELVTCPKCNHEFIAIHKDSHEHS